MILPGASLSSLPQAPPSTGPPKILAINNRVSFFFRVVSLRLRFLCVPEHVANLVGVPPGESLGEDSFFSVHESAQTVREVINAGAQGYVARSRAGHDLVDAVRNVLDGGTFFPTLARSA